MNQAQRDAENEMAQDHTSCRIEDDALGDVQVPAEHLWGAQTSDRALIFRSAWTASVGGVR